MTNNKTKTSPDLETGRPRNRIVRILSRLPRGFVPTFVLVPLVFAALAPILHLDAVRIGIVLTYAPRLVCLCAAIVVSLLLVYRQCLRRAILATLTTLLFGWQLGWGSTAGVVANDVLVQSSTEASSELTMLSFNIHDATNHASDLAELCRRHAVDIVNLQEVKPPSRQPFVDALTNYEFVLPDESAKFEHSNHGPFSSLIGFRKGRFDLRTAHVETALTAYRTYAVNVALRTPNSKRTNEVKVEPISDSTKHEDKQPTELAASPTANTSNPTTKEKSQSEHVGSPVVQDATTEATLLNGRNRIWIVNVHTTKAFWSHGGIPGLFTKADMKSAWHVRERDDLDRWLRLHRRGAVVAAGDFNSPWQTHNMKLFDMQSAHLAAGQGAHLTFPRRFPVVGLDHVLGNRRIRFQNYQIIDAGFSDHCAQLTRFNVY